MYESAVPLARLYSPLIQIDDTFILQEYFVPQSNFMRWIELTKPIYARIAKEQQVHLLNTTIRFVKHDKDTYLPYAQAPGGVYAFVLYYRIRRTREADEALKAFHRYYHKKKKKRKKGIRKEGKKKKTHLAPLCPSTN